VNPKLLIWISVVLSALAQIFLKHGLSNLQRQSSGDRRVHALAMGMICQGFIWLWGICFVAATGLWLLGLQSLDLSYAYPLVSFGYVLVSLLSAFFFRERVDGYRVAAVAVIGVGVILIAGS
jgi:undecaprenyl phosphate-alpha-L-ara4N flippase subunit ArnE